MKLNEKKKWSKPVIESMTSDELKETIVASACSNYGMDCSSVRILDIGFQI